MAEKKKSNSDWMDAGLSAFITSEAGEHVSKFTGWANEVKEAVNLANNEINYVASTFENNDVPSLAGFYAEAAHSGSFNINAALKGSEYRTSLGHSNTLGSSDIDTNWGEEYSSKYYKYADKSFDAQSKTIEEPGNQQAIQIGKERLIPSDQIDEANKVAAQRIAKEESNRPEVAERLKETKEHLTDRVKAPDGTESEPLKKSEADDWARETKKGNVKTFEQPEQVSVMSHVKEIGEAAGSAALIAVAMQSAPVVLGGLKKVMSDPNYSLSQYGSDIAEWGKDNALKIGADAFIKSAVAGSLCAAVKSGAIQGPLKDLSPAALSGIAVVGVESAKAMWRWQKGEITGEQAASESFKVGLKTCASLTGKAVGQALIPIPIVGGIIGSYVASFLIDQGIDSIENSRSIQMMKVLDETFVTHEAVLKGIFDVNTNYRDMITRYDEMIAKNEHILNQKRRSLNSQKKHIEIIEEVKQTNDQILAEIQKRLDIFKGDK